MAKGFTVKTVPPKKAKEPEWDIDAIKARMKGKKIVFCLPGRGTSYIFLKAFVQMCFDMVQNGMSIQISQDYSSMVNFARCKCLGANVLRGPDQLPWDGKLEYDYQLWIDSDIVFTSEKFWQLCDLALPAEEMVGAHIDEGTYYLDKDRYHLSITGQYQYFVGEESIVVDPGTLLWFNNKMPHGTVNTGDVTRIIFVFDVPHSPNNPQHSING